MKLSYRFILVLALGSLTFASPVGGVVAAQSVVNSTQNARPSSPSPTPAQPPSPSAQTPTANNPATGQSVSRERRAQAYAKMLEGQRFLVAARAGMPPGEALAAARQAFEQALVADPTLAEAHTALAEIAFYTEDVERAEREAKAAVASDKDNYGAHKILSRLYTIRAGLRAASGRSGGIVIARPSDKSGNPAAIVTGRNPPVDSTTVDLAIGELREVVRLYSKDAEAWALLGELYLQTRRTPEAIEAFKRWAAAPTPVDTRFYQIVTGGRELSPDAAEARLGEALLAMNQAGDAANAFRRAIAIDSTNKEYLQLLGKAIETGGIGGNNDNNRNLIAELQRVIAGNPGNSDAVVMLAQVQARAGRADDAIATLSGAIEREQGTDRATLQAELAQMYANALRYDEAIAAYEAALKVVGISDTSLRTDADREFAGRVLNRVIELQRQRGKADDAARTIERLRRLLGASDPAPELQSILGLREQGKQREALAAIRAARARFPEQSVFLQLEAETLANLGQVDEAVALLRGQLKNNSEDFDQYLYISNIYVQAGRAREGVDAARKALELAPSDSPESTTQALVMLSSAQERAGDARGAEDSLRRVLAREPDNAIALNNLGYFLVERNERLPEALEMIQRAVQSEPFNASFLDSLGWAYFKLNRLEEAARYLGEAARRNAASMTVQEHLGDLYARLGKIEQARNAWQKALGLTQDKTEMSRLKLKLDGATPQR